MKGHITIMKRRILTAVIASVILGVLAWGVSADLATGTKAPAVNLPTIDGKTYTFSPGAKGSPSVTVLDIWATWCPPCRAEIPQLIALQKKFKGKSVKFVGIAIDQNKSDVNNFAKQQRINYTIAWDKNADKVGESFQVKGIPATYIIDSKGIIRFAHSGFPRDAASAKAEGAKIEREINSILNK